jgi:glycosyltransferase involved in cell wall biosynthesis
MVSMSASTSFFGDARYYAFSARSKAVRSLERLRPRSNKIKLIVFDPALIGFAGHHLEWARMIKSGLSETFDVKFFINFWAASKIVAELRAQPTCFGGYYPQSGDFAEAKRDMLASLGRIDYRDLTPETIFLLHTLTVYHLEGLSDWFNEIPAKHRPRLFLQFQFPLEFLVNNADDHLLVLKVARNSIDKMCNCGNVILTTNSDLLKDRLTSQLGHTWQLMPLPLRWPDHVDLPAGPNPVFGFYGGLRNEKGARILAETIPVFIRQYPDTHFIVHAPKFESDEIAVCQLSNLSQVELIRSSFPRKSDYFAQMCRAHFVLLPYDPGPYAVRTSGIVLEALGLGRGVITTDGSWLAHELLKFSGAGVTMQSFSANALYNCLERAREMIASRSWKIDVNHEIMGHHNTAAFCDTLARSVLA